MVSAPPEPHEDDPRPVVALPRQGLPGAIIAGTAVVAALLLFVALDARRRAATREPVAVTAPATAFPSPPPLALPPASVSIDPVVLVTEAPPRPFRPGYPIAPVLTAPALPSPGMALPPYVSPPLIVPTPPDGSGTDYRGVADDRGPPSARRASGSALVIDGGSARGGVAATEAPSLGASPTSNGGQPGRPGPGIGGDDAPARLTSIGDQTMVMPVGTVIPAVLETPIDTARPGLVRAIVSQDTRGFNGKRVLVPRGSRLIGDYQADVRSGQNRVLVTWNRLIRPDGTAIRLVSPTADPLGGAGVPGKVETFFWQRFASALLQSALTVGVNLASRPGNGSVIVGLPTGQVNSVVGQSLLPGNDLRPKITVKQGAALSVFVARDLDFTNVEDRR